MRRLSLRARLLAAVGLVAVVQAGAALIVISVARDELLDQIDARLAAAAADVEAGVDLARPAALVAGRDDGVRIGDLYQGIRQPDGTLVTVVAVTDRGEILPPPDVPTSWPGAAEEGPITVDARSSEVEYRVLAVGGDGGRHLLLASPLDGYEWTMNRLTGLVATAAAAVTLFLAALTWWVLHLGVTPVKRMTAAAEAIAAGNLSERIEDADPDTEAGQLGLALNTMMGRIESSFQERAEAEARLRRFIADASHELRTPVATIRGYAELYRAGGLAERSDLDDAMRRTGQESERMTRLISDLLNLARLDRTRELETSDVDLGVLAQEVVADASASDERRLIGVEVPSDPVVVSGDEDLLRQTLANLVGNALVHAGPDAATNVIVAGDDTTATMSVADDGEGMAEDVAQRATERFFRADPSRSRHRGGSGLGLAIVASIVEAHGGRLDIESAPGRGTTVTVELAKRTGAADSQPTHR
ncbi:MAG: HAMP domain-containing sensor histidine kinase [Actinomycetota bacterium]